jgi:hypothetical protein
MPTALLEGGMLGVEVRLIRKRGEGLFEAVFCVKLGTQLGIDTRSCDPQLADDTLGILHKLLQLRRHRTYWLSGHALGQVRHGITTLQCTREQREQSRELIRI